MDQKIDLEITINAPKQATWEVISDYGNISKYIHGVVSSHITTEKEKGVGSTRHCDFPNMMMMKQYIVEEITDWKEGESFSYKVLKSTAPVMGGNVDWWISGDDTQSTIHVKIRYQTKGLMGRLMANMVRNQFAEQLNQGLVDIKEHLEKEHQMAAASNAA